MALRMGRTSLDQVGFAGSAAQDVGAQDVEVKRLAVPSSAKSLIAPSLIAPNLMAESLGGNTLGAKKWIDRIEIRRTWLGWGPRF